MSINASNEQDKFEIKTCIYIYIYIIYIFAY